MTVTEADPSAARERLRAMYRRAETIAVVGCSEDPSKAAHRIPRYLQEQGYRIVPVNPTSDEILGERAYDELGDVDLAVDVVDVFRPAEEALAITEAAAAIGATVVWLQEGITSPEARDRAQELGLEYVEDRCLGATHAELGLGPGPG